jgi:hypothetical protein
MVFTSPNFLSILLKKKTFKPRVNPFESMTAVELQQRFRFNHEGIEFITSLIQNDTTPVTKRSHSVPAIVQVMVALRYYATG